MIESPAAASPSWYLDIIATYAIIRPVNLARINIIEHFIELSEMYLYLCW